MLTSKTPSLTHFCPSDTGHELTQLCFPAAHIPLLFDALILRSGPRELALVLPKPNCPQLLLPNSSDPSNQILVSTAPPSEQA
jgi:hypothetical protein